MTRWWTTRRFDAVELVALALAVGLASLLIPRWYQPRVSDLAFSAAQEAAALEQRYGPHRYSRHEEEWVIRDYFRDRRGGYFVDVGANHFQDENNTYYLETRLGWEGLAIDPQTSFVDGYRQHRPRTRFFSFFVSDASNETTRFYLVPDNSLVASADQRFAERHGTEAAKAVSESHPVTVPTIRLTDLLDMARASRIDLLSIDVELAEPKVLAGFDIDRFKPSLVCIEAHRQVRQSILNYFADHRYVALGRYLRADLQNLYFAPLEQTVADEGKASSTGESREVSRPALSR